MKFLTFLCLFLLLSPTTMFAQNQSAWVAASGATGEVAAAWTEYGSTDVKAATCSSGIWSSADTIPNSLDSYPTTLCIVMTNAGNTILVWGNSVDGGIYSSIKLAGQAWTDATRISMISEYTTNPILTIDPAGNATVIWLTSSLGLRSSTSSAGSTTWSAPVTISE